MISFEKYFEDRVEDIMRHSNGQNFFVFRGFGVHQLDYLIRHVEKDAIGIQSSVDSINVAMDS